MNIFEINEQYRDILERAKESAIDRDGIVDDSIAVALDALSETRYDKIGAYCKLYKSEMALAKAIEEEAMAMTKRAHSHEMLATWLRERLRGVLSEGEKIETAQYKIKWRKSERVDITDFTKIDSRFVRVIPERREPDKNEIKAALKLGEVVPGAELVTINNMSIV
jgi:hypothetical protein